MPEASKKASNRKEAAVSFLKLAASGKVDEAYGNYIGANFRHHNPYFPGDAESLKAGMAEAHGKFPNTTLEVQHVLEEGDLVAVHSRVQHSPDTPEIAVVHIFRFEGDRVAELWDVGQEKPKESPNENDIF
jgi:predicted SnoaL-like aldol condensation-catalyzing enzyme